MISKSSLLSGLFLGLALVHFVQSDGIHHHHDASSEAHHHSAHDSSEAGHHPHAAPAASTHHHEAPTETYGPPRPSYKPLSKPIKSGFGIINFFRRIAGGLVALKGGLIKGHAAFWDAKGNALINAGKKISGRPPYGPEYKPQEARRRPHYQPHHH
eukprot:TRINITY_DN14967_c0_g1_i1.p2 TRINITY_DN14967_c0_g1~~TRINITY_DN14967_c0_g1_i1.p2  ORF type:complete len:156 (-),score=48.43 TRINITY_DN14967_c0_g1_i1:114-581(-)